MCEGSGELLRDAQSLALVVPRHHADAPAGARADELRRDHSARRERLTVEHAALGVAAEAVRHVSEPLVDRPQLGLLEFAQRAGVHRRLARRDEGVDVGALGLVAAVAY